MMDTMETCDTCGAEYEGTDLQLCTACKWVSKEDLEEWYRDALDENNPEVIIGSLTYDPSHVLKSTDPVAYRVGLNDYADYLCEEGRIVEGYND